MDSFAALARAAAVVATGRLGWLPADFWQSTGAELRQALEAQFGPVARPLSQNDLDRLKERLGDGG